MKEPKFNYVIGRYWRGHTDYVSTYAFCGSEVHYGTEEQAFKALEHVKWETGDNDFRVFRLMDMGTHYDPDPC